jgi:hypothetical protein
MGDTDGMIRATRERATKWEREVERDGTQERPSSGRTRRHGSAGRRHLYGTYHTRGPGNFFQNACTSLHTSAHDPRVALRTSLRTSLRNLSALVCCISEDLPPTGSSFSRATLG